MYLNRTFLCLLSDQNIVWSFISTKHCFNVDKCSVMHIRHNNMQSNYNMSSQQLPTTDQQRDIRIIITKDQVAKTNREKLQNREQSTGIHCRQFQVQKQRTDPPIIQIPSPPTSRTCSAILVSIFKARH